MLKISLITLAALAIVAAVGAAWARHNGYCAGGDYLNRVTASVSRKLDLNDAQNQKLQRLAEILRTLRGDWSEGRGQRSDEIERLLAAPTLDRDRAVGLLTNAIRHTPQGGAAPTVSSHVDDARWLLAVSDTGLGIANEELSRLITPFYRADPSRQRQSGGVGLGLYLSRVIAEAHSGKLEIESAVGRGTKVIVSIPVAASF